MAVNGAISKTTFTETTVSYTSKIRPVHITELRTAIDRLQSYAANVDNCGNCTYCQTCQSATCQSARVPKPELSKLILPKLSKL